MAVIASQSTTKVIVSEDGARGEAGADGIDGTGFNNVRKSKLDNPLCHLFKTNKLVEASAPTGTDSDVNFTRTTTATYVDRYGVVQSAGVNEIREEKEGFLLEGASTNNILFSDNFSSGLWEATFKVNIISTNNPSIDGLNTAFLVEDNSTTQTLRLRQVITGLTDTDYTASIFAKADTSTICSMRVAATGGNAVFDSVSFNLLTGTWNDSGVNTSKIKLNSTKLHDGWWRLEFTIFGGEGNTIIDFRFQPTDTPTASTGRCFVKGAQVEALPFATSYIPTTSAPVTRAADSCSITAENNFPDQSTTPFTMMGNISIIGYVSNFLTIANVFNSDYSKGITTLLSNNSSTNQYSYVVRSPSGGTFVSYGGMENNVKSNYINVYDQQNHKIYKNGELKGSDSITDITTEKPFLVNITAQYRFFHISDFKIYDFAINDDEAKLIGGQ